MSFLDGDSAGRSVSSAGDVNGDGCDDLLVGSIWNNDGGYYAGAAYLVHGPVYGSISLASTASSHLGEPIYI